MWCLFTILLVNENTAVCELQTKEKYSRIQLGDILYDMVYNLFPEIHIMFAYSYYDLHIEFGSFKYVKYNKKCLHIVHV